MIEAEARAAERFGTGPGAVRFISGTYTPHVELEQALAAFHGRDALSPGVSTHLPGPADMVGTLAKTLNTL